jgi:hypothetical protein
LGGTVRAVLDVGSHLPVALHLDPDSPVHDRRYLPRIVAGLPPDTLRRRAAGVYAVTLFEAVAAAGARCLTPLRRNAAYPVRPVRQATPTLRDRVIQTGLDRSNRCRVPLRRIEDWSTPGGPWRGWLTTTRAPAILPAAAVPGLSAQRGRIEAAYLVTKRRLNLAYRPAGAFNALARPVWTTWRLDAVLIELSEAVAAALGQPLERSCVAMVYRGRYHVRRAVAGGATADPVAYLAAPAQPDLGSLTRRRLSREHASGQRRLDPPL